MNYAEKENRMNRYWELLRGRDVAVFVFILCWTFSLWFFFIR